MTKASKDIELLDDFEYVLLRPEIFVSSTLEKEESVHFLQSETNIIQSEINTISVGMYKILWEIFDNSLDEIKRVKEISKDKANKRHIIEITLNTELNKISIRDNGDGFSNATDINIKSGVTNVETAFMFLRSGSNFKNDNVGTKLAGTNGVGATLTNMLSDNFYVLSVNKNSRLEQNWTKFVTDGKPNIKKGAFTGTGTRIDFIPRKSIFKENKYDVEIIRSQLAFRYKCLKLSPDMKNMEVIFYVDDNVNKTRMDLPSDIFHKDSYVVEMEDFIMAISPKYEKSSDFMMVNSTQCMGSPVKVVQDMLNTEIFKEDKANNYYNVQLFINLPPALINFGNQIKTDYSVTKTRILPHMLKILGDKKIKLLHRFKTSETYKKIVDGMTPLIGDKEQKAIQRDKKKLKKISDKYFPASLKKEYLFLVEGDSAGGSISRGRNPHIHGIYQLRGKIKNCRKISDLREDTEIMELISIMDLEFKSSKTSYKNIIIATDYDPDGIGHIASLLINFFYRWYPKVIEDGKIFIMKVPLVSYGIGKKKHYIYSLKDWDKYQEDPKSNKINKRYLKGLGALSDEDWEHVFSNLHLMRINSTSESMKILDMAFNKDTTPRKEWLDSVSKK
jgi:DNA gyrase/topoisomerase IV subunit B